MNPPDGSAPDDVDGTPVRVVVVDDSAVVRSGLVSILGLTDSVAVVGEAANGEEAVQVVRRLRPDVVLLDVQMPRRDGVSAARELSDLTAIIMTTFTETPEVVHAAVEAGAVGYLVHGTFEADDLVAAVLAAAGGSGVFGRPALAALRLGRPTPAPDRSQFGLSQRQAEIMDLVAAGRGNAEISGALFLAEKTVKNHINHIFAGLGVRTRAEAVAVWLGGARADDLRPL
ncbi:response regulator [Jannaschia sp. R86511]|uniref:response regulator n=1 Tax=Jannaschia sp. R86511 TaxID=3093853 RepID=UPI0036D2855E